MNNHFLLSADQRLEHWKMFRKSLSEKSEQEKIAEISKYWAIAPLKNIAYNCDDASSWLTIWEMIRAGDWCRNSVAIGMDGTLRLAGFDPERLTLGIILDQDISAMLMVVKIDADCFLNYDWGLLTPYPKTNHRWLRRFRWKGRAYMEF
jgi:hypothetical protein